MARFGLSDFEWGLIQPLLPNKPRGVARVDDRRVINGIFWVQVFETLAEKSPDSMQFIDSSIIRAHQQAAAQKGGRITPLAVLVAD